VQVESNTKFAWTLLWCRRFAEGNRDCILRSKWHASETAKLYEPTIFENKKEDKGYWF